MVCKRLEVSDAVQVINHNDAHLIKKSLIVEYLPPCPERDSDVYCPKGRHRSEAVLHLCPR
jgi:hypothetical protein